MGQLTRGLAAGAAQLALGLAAATVGLAVSATGWSPALACALAAGVLVVALEAGAQRGDDRAAPAATDRWLAGATSAGVALALIGAPFELAVRGGGEPAGLFLALLGAGLRAGAIATLGDRFISAAQPPRQLATRGVYAWVRHPSELGLWLIAVGFALAAPGLASATALAVIAATSVLRMRREDRVLAAAFGRAYRAYAVRVPALWPGVS